MKITIEKFTIFSIYFLAVVTYSSILIFLISEILGAKAIYDFLKDQGSFIAGVMGGIGVVALVLFQLKANREIIDSSRDMIYEERFEIDRDTALHEVYVLERCLTDIASNLNWGDMNQSDYSSYISGYIQTMKAIVEKTSSVEKFIRKYQFKTPGNLMGDVFNFMMLYASMSQLALNVIESGASLLFQSQKDKAIKTISENLLKLHGVFSEDDKSHVLRGFSSIGEKDPRPMMQAWEIIQSKTLTLLKKEIYELQY